MKAHLQPKVDSHLHGKKNLKELKVLLLFLSMLCFHRSFAQNLHNNEIAIIKSNRAVSNNAIAKHDVKGIEQFWLNDFVQIIGRGTSETGKDNISASWKKLFNTNPKVFYIRIPEQIIISENDTMAWETGKWTGIHTYSKGGIILLCGSKETAVRC